MSKIELSTTSILNVPFHTYDQDFTFLVNGEKIKTSRISSELLSPIICKNHLQDPTIDTFTINTSHQGNFSHILDLLQFKTQTIQENELPFIIEVLEQFGNDKIQLSNNENYQELTTKNIFKAISAHEKYQKIYSKKFNEEIDFISSHFFERVESNMNDITKLKKNTIYFIVKNDKLRLENEDQLVNFINELYKQDSTFSFLYDTVLFTNVSSEKMNEFLYHFDYNEINGGIWKCLKNRLEKEIKENKNNNIKLERYINETSKGKIFSPSENQPFSGILNYIRNNSNNKIENEINFTSSTINSNYPLSNVVLYEEQDKHFETKNNPDSWMRFDFKNRRVIPTFYTIRSVKNWGQNLEHPRSWVIECSKDANNWQVVDTVQNCEDLNGSSLTHTFKIKNPSSDEFQYVRMKLTSTNCGGSNYLCMSLFELYGTLI